KKGGLVILMKEHDWPIKQTGYHQTEEQQSFYGVYDIEMFDDDDEPVVVTPFYGEGRIMVLTYVPNNLTLQESPELALPAVKEILQQDGPIYFDEYHLNLGTHGSFINMAAQFLT